MKKLIAAGIAVTICIAACENGQRNTDPKELADDKNEAKFEDTPTEDAASFAVEAADGSLMEVELGKLAEMKGVHKKVKDFGKMMVTDHSGANMELQALAQSMNISLPVAISEEKQKKYEEFQSEKGAEFDKNYISFMIKDHKEDISKFRKEAKDGADAALREWAGSKIPTLEHHLAEALMIDSLLKNK